MDVVSAMMVQSFAGEQAIIMAKKTCQMATHGLMFLLECIILVDSLIQIRLFVGDEMMLDKLM